LIGKESEALKGLPQVMQTCTSGSIEVEHTRTRSMRVAP